MKSNLITKDTLKIKDNDIYLISTARIRSWPLVQAEKQPGLAMVSRKVLLVHEDLDVEP